MSQLQPTVPAEGRKPLRIGNIGHLTRISNKLLQLANSNAEIQSHLQVYHMKRKLLVYLYSSFLSFYESVVLRCYCLIFIEDPMVKKNLLSTLYLFDFSQATSLIACWHMKCSEGFSPCRALVFVINLFQSPSILVIFCFTFLTGK